MRFLLLLLSLFFTGAQGAIAQSEITEPSVYLEELTWEEVKARLLTGADSMIIPTGGTEQNGPHLILGKHNKIVYFTAGEVARKLGNAFVAPVIAYVPEGRISPPEGHMNFTGTISVADTTLAALLEDAARSFKQHGFKKIYFLGDHGGSQAAQSAVASKLTAEWKKEGVLVLNVSDYYANNGQEAWLKENKPDIKNPAGHAGFFDTSELSAVNPDGIRIGMVGKASTGKYEQTGVAGNPGGASTEIGRQLLGLKIKAAVDQITAAH